MPSGLFYQRTGRHPLLLWIHCRGTATGFERTGGWNLETASYNVMKRRNKLNPSDIV